MPKCYVLAAVVPSHEALTVGLGVFETAEAVRKVRPVVEGAELAFRRGVVITHVRTAVRCGDPEVGQQVHHRFGDHWGAAVSVQRELALDDALLGNRLVHQS